MAHSRVNNVLRKLSHTMIRGRTYYTNFRLNDSTSFVRLTLGADSRKQAEVIMNQIRPYTPLVQNGTMEIDKFKRIVGGSKQTANEALSSRHMQRNELSKADLPLTNQIAAALILSRTTVAQTFVNEQISALHKGGHTESEIHHLTGAARTTINKVLEA